MKLSHKEYMKQEYLNKLPQWYNDENGIYDLVLSDDIDSLLGCTILKEVKNWNINYFYKFDALGKTNNVKTKKAVGVDIALCKGKCFDNHVTMLSNSDICNPNSINPNTINKISADNYFDKYCGSTALLIWSIYNLPLPKSDIGKLILLAIDSTYLGHFSKYSRDINANKYYLCDVLGMKELYDFQCKQQEHDFKKVLQNYNLKAKIKTEKGILSSYLKLDDISKELGIKIELPKDTFYLMKNLYNNQLPIINEKTKEDISQTIFSFALTGKKYASYSTIK